MTDLISRMLAECTDCRACNKLLKDYNISGIRFQCVRRSPVEPRRRYGLYIFSHKDDIPSYRLAYCSTSLYEVISQLQAFLKFERSDANAAIRRET